MEFKDVVSGYKYSDPNKPILTKFLTLHEQQILYGTLHKHVDVSLDGGYEAAERKRALIHHPKDPGVVAFLIKISKQYGHITHQNILGTILSLGCSITSIGDILPKQQILIVTKEIAPFIKQEFTSLQGVPITLEEYHGDIKDEKEVEHHSISVESLRLDLVVGKLMKSSRKQAELWIQSGFVKVNQIVIEKQTVTLKEQDIISIRKYGRFIVEDTQDRSRKGKIILKYGKFI